MLESMLMNKSKKKFLTLVDLLNRMDEEDPSHHLYSFIQKDTEKETLSSRELLVSAALIAGKIRQ